ncbi:MAG: YgaP family membrane protein [Thermogutta sp.]
MTVERGLRLIAGVVVTASVLLAMVHSQNWLFLTLFTGLNLFQSAFTNWCPAVWILRKLGLKSCVAAAA